MPALQPFPNDLLLNEGRKVYNEFIQTLEEIKPNAHAYSRSCLDEAEYDALTSLATEYRIVESNCIVGSDTKKTNNIIMKHFAEYLLKVKNCPVTYQAVEQPKHLQTCLENIENECLGKKPIHPALMAAMGAVVGAVLGAMTLGAVGLLMSLPMGGVGVFVGLFTGALKGAAIGTSVAISGLSGASFALLWGKQNADTREERGRKENILKSGVVYREAIQFKGMHKGA